MFQGIIVKQLASTTGTFFFQCVMKVKATCSINIIMHSCVPVVSQMQNQKLGSWKELGQKTFCKLFDTDQTQVMQGL